MAKAAQWRWGRWDKTSAALPPTRSSRRLTVTLIRLGNWPKAAKRFSSIPSHLNRKSLLPARRPRKRAPMRPFDRSRAERHRIPVDDDWQIPWGGSGRPERGMEQLGGLGAGNHFIELQRSENSGTLFVQVHTGSRGFGHGLATIYFEMARHERPDAMTDIDLGLSTG